MREFTTETDGGLLWHRGHERVWIVPWGRDGLRVRVTHEAQFLDLPQALLEPPPEPGEVRLDVGDDLTTLSNGRITVQLTPRGNVTFVRTSDGEVLLKECVKNTSEYLGRTFIPYQGVWKVEQRFYGNDEEKLFGLGQHQNGYLDQKGCVVDLLHRNMEVAIPLLVSSLGYGMLWNHPGVGRVELGRNETRWVAEAARQIDYYIVAGDSCADVMERYAEVAGFPTRFPQWASGFWQSKLRYRSQSELLAVAREYKKRALPISALVIDFFHWTQMGDWKFDPEAWPDPAGMVRELKEMGIEVVVSVWPTVNLTSENYGHMESHGMLLRNERGRPVQNASDDNRGGPVQTFYDAMNPEARAFLWERIRENYCSQGITRFWLDTIEPELSPLEQDNTRYHLGNGMEVACLYPKLHQQGFYEGLLAEGETEVLTLGRSAWAGSQRFGAAVWSADVPSTFDSLRRQVTGGLNIGLSGIPWWTTDIGGFYGGDVADPAFHELLIRWFQYAVFCPICRMHGVRRSKTKKEGEYAPNEVWSFGDEVCRILSDQLHLRQRLRRYVMEQMRTAERRGHPPMRPLFFDFPDDPRAWCVEDEFLLGPDILVAPVLEPGARGRGVYLPEGAAWQDAWTGEAHSGGADVEADAPLDRIPVYFRAGSDPLESPRGK
jgi:alpha-D-xyloside xylohydrolase